MTTHTLNLSTIGGIDRPMLRSTLTLKLVLPIVIIVAGCPPQDRPAGSPVERAWEAPPPPVPAEPRPLGPTSSQAAATSPAQNDRAVADSSEAIAFVNGTPISRSQITRVLMEGHALNVLEELVLLTAVRQRAAQLGLTVTQADIAAAHDDALRRIATPIGDPNGQPLDRPAAERLLAEFLRAKGLSPSEWNCRMEQRAYLLKIAQAEVARMEITEQMLRDEYALVYGERVQIRHIQVSSPEAMQRVRAALAGQQDFEALARQFSENALTAKQGGLIPAFSRHDGSVPPLIREKAFAMAPGETSEPLRDGTWYHLIRVERRFPASGVGFENVDHQTLRDGLTERLVAQRMDALELELFRAAKVDIRDPQLAKQFRAAHQQAAP